MLWWSFPSGGAGSANLVQKAVAVAAQLCGAHSVAEGKLLEILRLAGGHVLEAAVVEDDESRHAL